MYTANGYTVKFDKINRNGLAKTRAKLVCVDYVVRWRNNRTTIQRRIDATRCDAMRDYIISDESYVAFV